MSSAFERCFKKMAQAIGGGFMGDESGGQAEDIGIVVPAGEFGKFGKPGDGGSNATVFIGCNGHSVCASADKYAEGALAIGHRFSGGMGIVGIIAAGIAMRAKVKHLII
jgi:hypothetical protein